MDVKLKNQSKAKKEIRKRRSNSKNVAWEVVEGR
jgi:hypothetical protein